MAGLEKTYAMRILIILSKEGPMSRTAIYENMSSAPRTPMDRVNELLATRLIEEIPRPSNPRIMLIQLTKKGEKVAKHLVEIEKEITEA